MKEFFEIVFFACVHATALFFAGVSTAFSSVATHLQTYWSRAVHRHDEKYMPKPAPGNPAVELLSKGLN